MKRRAPIMDKSSLYRFTETSKRRLKETLEHSDNLRNDPDKKERIEAHECVVCFYGSRFGGAAMTEQDCMSCGEEQLYSSTATDVLCNKCAKDNNLCKHCGADIELKQRRK